MLIDIRYPWASNTDKLAFEYERLRLDPDIMGWDYVALRPCDGDIMETKSLRDSSLKKVHRIYIYHFYQIYLILGLIQLCLISIRTPKTKNPVWKILNMYPTVRERVIVFCDVFPSTLWVWVSVLKDNIFGNPHYHTSGVIVTINFKASSTAPQ